MEKSFRMGWFFDAGQVYGKGETMAISDLRYSTGLVCCLDFADWSVKVQLWYAHQQAGYGQDRVFPVPVGYHFLIQESQVES